MVETMVETIVLTKERVNIPIIHLIHMCFIAMSTFWGSRNVQGIQILEDMCFWAAILAIGAACADMIQHALYPLNGSIYAKDCKMIH